MEGFDTRERTTLKEGFSLLLRIEGNFRERNKCENACDFVCPEATRQNF